MELWLGYLMTQIEPMAGCSDALTLGEAGLTTLAANEKQTSPKHSHDVFRSIVHTKFWTASVLWSLLFFT